MKTLLFTITTFILLTINSFSQAPDTIWTKTYGDSSFDHGSAIIQNGDSSFIVTGSIGTELITKAYTTDIWLFGIDAAGSTLWSHNYGGMGAGGIVPDTNSEFFVAADTYNQGSWEDMEILKVNGFGDTMWTRTFYYSQHEYAPEIKNTDDGGLIILGFTYGYPRGALLIKTDEFGDSIWTKLFSEDTYILHPSSLELDDDGGYLFLISKYDSTFIYKTDSFGNLIWKNIICNPPIYVSKFLKNEDGNYLLLGTYQTNSDSNYVWISLLNDSLEIIWTHTHFINGNTEPSTIKRLNTGGYLIIGEESDDSYSQRDGFIMKINDSGEIIWEETYGGISNDYFNDILILENNDFFIVGTTDSYGAGGSDAWVLKFSTDTASTGIKALNTAGSLVGFNLHQNYPNPFNPSTKIRWQAPSGTWQTLKIYDVLGNEVAILVDEYKPAGTYEVEWNATEMPSGVYFYQLRAGDFIQTKKMILLK